MRLEFLSLTCLGLASVAAARNIPIPKVARQAGECNPSERLPSNFTIINFTGQSLDGGETLGSFDFGYLEKTNNVTTHCYFNSSSLNAGPSDRTPRFPCKNEITQFIYQNQRLTLIQGICPDSNGDVPVEASGSADVELECGSANTAANATEVCISKEEEFSGRFFSLNPAPPKTNMTTVSV